MEEEILNELKALTEILKQDVQIRSDQLQLQVDKNANEKELEEIAKAEQEQQQLEITAEKAVAEKRAVQLEQFIDKLEANEVPESEFRTQLLEAIQKIDTNNSTAFQSLDAQLETISLKLDETEQSKNVDDASYFSSMTIIVFLCFAIPAVATYKFLSRLFDGFMA